VRHSRLVGTWLGCSVVVCVACGRESVVEWREIEIFLTLAEELHFGRTAERLHLSQARVSQTVQALERRIGGRLFDRTSRQVRLTALGEHFRARLRPGYEQILQAYEFARDSARGIVGELRVSAISSMVVGPLFGQILRRFETAHPLCTVLVDDTPTNVGLEQARDGRTDVLAAYLPLNQDDLTIGPLLSKRPRALVVPVGHPLVERGYATFEDLADVPIVRLTTIPEETAEVWSPARTPSGRPIRRVDIASSSGAALGSLITRGLACHATVVGFLEAFRLPGTVEIPLHGLPMLESSLVWVTSRESAAIRAFAKIAEETTS
jgi:DNA-binding transcriptional LysR family regulator